MLTTSMEQTLVILMINKRDITCLCGERKSLLTASGTLLDSITVQCFCDFCEMHNTTFLAIGSGELRRFENCTDYHSADESLTDLVCNQCGTHVATLLREHRVLINSKLGKLLNIKIGQHADFEVHDHGLPKSILDALPTIRNTSSLH